MVYLVRQRYPRWSTRSVPSAVRSLNIAIVAALLGAGLLAPTSLAAGPPTTGAARVPKVVLIVGPSGSATDGYRTQAQAAAAVARRYTSDVVEVYSPDATWPVVRAALDGASLVVYMGHGNGWPSPYHNELYPPTENGFGLNPSAGGGDSAHQYFGEAAIGSQVKLARNAVVLLHHLCYASGLTEPGMSVGSLDDARQRVDNYAAGFIRAGAAAVIAEAYDSPSYLVKAILGSDRSIQNAWQTAPSANGHRIAFASQRSPGYVAQMDPETASTGFSRSIVMRAGLVPGDVRAGALGSAAGAYVNGALATQPSLSGIGFQLGSPAFRDLPSAGTQARLAVPYTIAGPKALPDGVQASVRWDPIAVLIPPVQPSRERSTGSGWRRYSIPTSDGIGARRPAVDPVASDAPIVAPRLDAPPATLDLVVPEQLGDVVAPGSIQVTKRALVLPLALPATPGRYRLTVTLHDADGVAYDAATQALLSSLIVRVTGDYDGSINAVPAAELPAGSPAALGVQVANLGRTAWGQAATPPVSNLSGWIPAKVARLVGRWVPLSEGTALQADPAFQTTSTDLPIELQPGATFDATLDLVAPTAPGDYLLVLDVLTPDQGSLVATGVDPTLVRITVVAASD